MTSSDVAGSFRDPSGFVFRRDGVVHRQVNERHRAHYDHLMGSGLYGALVDAGLLVPHQEVDPSLAPAPGAYRVVRPQAVPFISYPYEWCFGQLRAAALATLRIQRIAMDHGMSLRDASAFNIQFVEGRAILIDTLSFERRQEGTPWVAYRQFCQHFLAPLALMHYRDVRLGTLSRAHLDGVPLDLAARLLPFRARLRIPLLLHLFAHARSQARHQGDATAPASRRAHPFSSRAFLGLVDSLTAAVTKLSWNPDRSVWAGYYAEGESYTAEAMQHKQKLVEEFLDEVRPATVWDLGANTGLFSRLAAERGSVTVAFDQDPGAVEANHRTVAERGETRLLPLVMDLANPSPALGWESRERMTLQDRGPADLAMALALIHHLAIANNVPLPRLAAFLRQLCASLIIEFVPKGDPMVRTLLATREDVFPSYTQDGFEEAFGRAFVVDRREPIAGSQRVLYLMHGR